MKKTLSGRPAQDAPPLPADLAIPGPDAEALLAKIKEVSERLFLVLDGGAGQGKSVSSEAGMHPDEDLTQKPRVNPFAPEELKRLSRLRTKRRRNAIDEFFEWPIWDILLELAAARAEGVHLSVSSVCIAAAAPQSTALRKLAALEEAKFVERYYHGHDGRRVHLRLTDQGLEMVASALRGELAFYRSIIPPS